MKIVVGIDSEHLFREAIHLLGRLDFVGARPVLAHVSDAFLAPYMDGAVLPPMAEVVRVARQSENRLLDEADRACDEASLSRNREVRRLEGNPSLEILNLVEAEHADLVAIGSHRKGGLESAFLGSVGRALAISGDRSFLIGRSGVADRGNVSAVFATDHSHYADGCFDELLRLDPSGLTDIHIVFAAERGREFLRQTAGIGDDEEPAFDEIRERIRAKGEAMVQRCLESGRQADYRMVDGYALDALRNAMYETKSELLVIGAKGHGFLERLVIGSLSLHMVVAEPFSVLVLRHPKEHQK